jgi:hypothetical protein
VKIGVVLAPELCDTLNMGYISLAKQMNTSELEFAVFCIENIAENLGLVGDEIYKLQTEKSDILDNYIVPCYDALHTQGKEYIVNDIIEVMREKGLV